MKEYQKIIDERLSKYMPSCVQLLIEAEMYVKNAPKVSGYFKLISIRYMKRVNDIKKLCVDYINTYIEGALNLAKNMDDVKLTSAQDSLAKDLDFDKIGVSTNGKTKADTKTGVLFLTGDNALKEKTEYILQKIRLRAKKSQILLDWAELMIMQSKIIASDIIYDETNKMLKDETLKEKRKVTKAKEEENWKNKFKAVETENKDLQKKLNDLINNYGEPAQWFSNKKINIKDFADSVKNIKSEDIDYPVTDNETLSDKGDVNKLRTKFYNEYGFDKQAQNIVKEIDKNKDKINDIDLTDSDWQYMFACSAVNDMKDDGSFSASPVDVCIAAANTPDAVNKLKQKYENYKNPVGVNLNDFIIPDFDFKKIKPAFDLFITDKNFVTRIVYIYTQIFNYTETGVSEKLHIMKPSEFLFEEELKSNLLNMSLDMTMVDILSDIDDGCMYIGNVDGANGVDYIILNKDNNFDFYKETGNVQSAINSGTPQHKKLISLSGDLKYAILDKVIGVCLLNCNSDF